MVAFLKLVTFLYAKQQSSGLGRKISEGGPKPISQIDRIGLRS